MLVGWSMKTEEHRPIRLTAFVGRSVLSIDELVWPDIRAILESFRPLGFDFEDAREAQLRPISEKVRELIERNHIYIGILTRRSPLGPLQIPTSLLRRLWTQMRSPTRAGLWSTSPWAVQVSGFAIGRGKKVLLMIEESVDFPVADLDADTEWIPFHRDSIPNCAPRLVQMITNLLAGTLPAPPALPQTVAPTQMAPAEGPSVPTEAGDDYSTIMRFLDEGQIERVDELFAKYLSAQAEGSFKA